MGNKRLGGFVGFDFEPYPRSTKGGYELRKVPSLKHRQDKAVRIGSILISSLHGWARQPPEKGGEDGHTVGREKSNLSAP